MAELEGKKVAKLVGRKVATLVQVGNWLSCWEKKAKLLARQVEIANNLPIKQLAKQSFASRIDLSLE